MDEGERNESIAPAASWWVRAYCEWPQMLAELVPELLPAVPPDRLDGQPLKYALHDGKPVLYSIGNDRDDDRGRAVQQGAYASFMIEFMRPSPDQLKNYQSNDNGDWILWPPSAEPKEEPPPSY